MKVVSDGFAAPPQPVGKQVSLIKKTVLQVWCLQIYNDKYDFETSLHIKYDVKYLHLANWPDVLLLKKYEQVQFWLILMRLRTLCVNLIVNSVIVLCIISKYYIGSTNEYCNRLISFSDLFIIFVVVAGMKGFHKSHTAYQTFYRWLKQDACKQRQIMTWLVPWQPSIMLDGLSNVEIKAEVPVRGNIQQHNLYSCLSQTESHLNWAISHLQ